MFATTQPVGYQMEPAVRVALTGRSRVYTTDDFDDTRREASKRAIGPRPRAVPTAEFHFGNRSGGSEPPQQKKTPNKECLP
jgi:hypothetical protein